MSRPPAAPVRRYGDPCLRRVCRPAEPGTAATAELLDRMWAALDREGGVGLAAPQVGSDLRVIVARVPGEGRRPRRLEMVNPSLLETFGPDRPFEEGCLSFPGLFVTIARPTGMAVAYHDREGGEQTARDEDLLARIVLHELDHLEGRLFIDRMPRWRRWWHAPRLLWIRGSGRGGAERETA